MALPEGMRMKNEVLLPSWTVNIMQNLRKHDEIIYRHSVRVGFIAYTLWKDFTDMHPERNLEPHLNNLFISGLVHDCGKLEIPPKILAKRENIEILSDYEKFLITRHTHAGEIMVEMYDSDIAEIIKGHHRWGNDGEEHPLNQNKNITDYSDIELAQMILAIADKADVAINRSQKGLLGVEVNEKSQTTFTARFQKETTAGLVKADFLSSALKYTWNIGTDQQNNWGEF